MDHVVAFLLFFMFSQGFVSGTTMYQCTPDGNPVVFPLSCEPGEVITDVSVNVAYYSFCLLPGVDCSNCVPNDNSCIQTVDIGENCVGSPSCEVTVTPVEFDTGVFACTLINPVTSNMAWIQFSCDPLTSVSCGPSGPFSVDLDCSPMAVTVSQVNVGRDSGLFTGCTPANGCQCSASGSCFQPAVDYTSNCINQQQCTVIVNQQTLNWCPSFPLNNENNFITVEYVCGEQLLSTVSLETTYSPAESSIMPSTTSIEITTSMISPPLKDEQPPWLIIIGSLLLVIIAMIFLVLLLLFRRNKKKGPAPTPASSNPQMSIANINIEWNQEEQNQTYQDLSDTCHGIDNIYDNATADVTSLSNRQGHGDKAVFTLGSSFLDAPPPYEAVALSGMGSAIGRARNVEMDKHVKSESAHQMSKGKLEEMYTKPHKPEQNETNI